MGGFVEWLVGTVVWLVANLHYLDRKRRGVGGFSRFLAFWLGTPTTWITWLVADEGSQIHLEPPPDDEDALFDEVRRDRALRTGGATQKPEIP